MDQWLLLATVYGPIVVRLMMTTAFKVSPSGFQVPQLWSRSLLEHGNDMASLWHVFTIAEIETEKECSDAQKANNRNVLTEAKKQGKEAYAAAKAQLTQEQAAASEAKKMEQLRMATEQKAEKVRLAAESKAKRAHAKVRSYSLSSDTGSLFLLLRQPNGKQHHKLLKDCPKVNSTPSLPQQKTWPRLQTKRI